MASIVGRLRNVLMLLLRPRTRTALRVGLGVPMAKLGRWRVQCPICLWRFRAFLPFGTPPQPNMQCARCGAMDRHRLVYLYLRDRTRIFTQRLRFLHFAPEASLVECFASLSTLTYVTTDLQTSGVAVSADITRLPFPDSSFDVVLCSHVLEHIEDDRAAMRELHRVLAPGGWALILIPIELEREVTYEDPRIVDPGERARHFGQGDHVRVYGRDFVTRMENAGFSVTVEHHAQRLDDQQMSRFGLRDEPFFLCVKEARSEAGAGGPAGRRPD